MVSASIGREERMMIRRLAVTLSAILILGLALSCGVRAQSATPEAPSAQTEPQGVGSATVVTFHGKIVNINTAAKQVTLEGPAGQRVRVDVRNPDNLRAAKVGEPFAARAYEIVTIRKKKPGEKVQSASLSEGIWTTNPNGAPGGSRAVQVRLVVTVDGIDEAHGTVTVKAPDGSTETVKARNPQNLKRLKVGDELVISIYRAIAISLAKESGAGAS
jgi:hypothetical protein